MSGPQDRPVPAAGAAGAARPARPGQPGRPPIDRGRIGWLIAGAVALVGGTILGWNADLLDAVVGPPAIVRAALVGTCVAVGFAMLVRAVQRLQHGRDLRSADLSAADLAVLVRGVRYVFLAVAAFAAGAGWLLAHPLPLIVALVIAGVDVLETSFLMLVVAVRRER